MSVDERRMVAESGSPPAADSEEGSRRVSSWLVVFAAFLGSVVGVIVARLVLVGFAGEFDFAGKTIWDYSFAGKTVWNYLDVFLVPVAVAVATFWFTSQQDRRQREAEDAQQKIAMDAEDQRAQDEALQVYLDRMSELLIYQRLHEKRNEYDAERVTARARTLAVLRRLDGIRKRTVLLFLREARLRACANRRATFAHGNCSQQLPSLSAVPWHMRYSPIGAASN